MAATTDFVVTLSGGEDTPSAKTYRPGEQLQGSVTLYLDQAVKCNHFFIRLGWHTEGRGSQYTEKVSELDVFQGEISASLPMTQNFSFTLPAQPWSYEGHYISIVWGVEFEVDVPWGRNLKHFAPFILSPRRQVATEWDQNFR